MDPRKTVRMRNLEDYLRPKKSPVQRMGKDKQIEIIMENTDFDRIHRAMLALDWRWYRSPTGVPSTAELKEAAESYLNIVWDLTEDDESQIYYTGSGGFMAYKYVIDGLKILSLQFELSGHQLDYGDVQRYDD